MYHVIRIEHNPAYSIKHAEEVIEFESVVYSDCLKEYDKRKSNSRLEICDAGDMIIYYVFKENGITIMSSYDQALNNKVEVECEDYWYPDGGF